MKVAIVILMFIATIATWIKRDKIPKKIYYGMIFVFIVISILQIGVILQEERIKGLEVFYGILKPSGNILLSAKDNVFPELEFGDSGAVLKYTGPKGSPIFRFAEENLLVISADNKGTIKISTLIRDNKGHIVAELYDNEWRVNKNKALDRNYTSNALEVKDADGDIILQIKLIANRIQLQGKFYNSRGGGIAIGKSPDPHRPGGLIDPTMSLKIKPIFKYPSELHLGEFINS